MNKRILSIVLTLCRVLCLMPTGVFAEGKSDIGTAGAAASITALTLKRKKSYRYGGNAK